MKIRLVLFLQLICYLSSFTECQPNNENDLSFQIQPYKSEYKSSEPIIILFKILSQKNDHTFCIFSENIYSIKIVSAISKTVITNGINGFINDEMLMEEIKVNILPPSYFYFKTTPYLGYIAINDIWKGVNKLSPGKYNVIINFNPKSKEYYDHSHKKQIVDNAWTGKLVSNEIEINIINQ